MKKFPPTAVAVRNSIIAVLATVTISACQISARGTSPDIKYSENARSAQSLQVPPDLSSISAGEQFVVPGNTGSIIARNTLLPLLDSARFVRQGSSSWLEVKVSPEELWPKLLAFIEEEGFEVSSTQPTTGLITTQWRKRGGESGSLAGAIDSRAKVRIAFRMERAQLEGSGARLFARLQTNTDSAVDNSELWSSSATHPDKSSVVLQRLLVFLGVQEQKARGVLSAAAAAAILSTAELEVSNTGTALVIHHSLDPSIEAVSGALKSLGASVDRKNSTAESISVSDAGGTLAQSDDVKNFVLIFSSIHVSKVSIGVASSEGERISAQQERNILSALWGEFS